MQHNRSIFNPEDFGKFFSENNARFVDIAFSYVRDMDAAQDIVMDSFARIWQRREELADETNMRGYAYMCVRNRCCSYLQQVSRRRQLSPPTCGSYSHRSSRCPTTICSTSCSVMRY